MNKPSLTSIVTRADTPSQRVKALVETASRDSFPIVGVRTLVNRDDKTYVNLKDIRLLVDFGAKVIKLNYSQDKGNYYHEVVYQGYRFITATHEPVKTRQGRVLVR